MSGISALGFTEDAMEGTSWTVGSSSSDHLLVILFGGKASQPLLGELHPSPP